MNTKITSLLVEMHGLAISIEKQDRDIAALPERGAAFDLRNYEVGAMVQDMRLCREADIKKYKALQKEHAEEVRAYEIKGAQPIDFTKNRTKSFGMTSADAAIQNDILSTQNFAA